MNVLNAAKPPDVVVQPGPDDSVSKVAFNPVADFLAVGSWDNQVRVYEVSPNTGQVVPKASVQHDGPALGLSWSKVSGAGGVSRAEREATLPSEASIK